MKRKINRTQISAKVMLTGLVVLLALIGCNKDENNDSTNIEAAKITISPENASMNVGEHEDFTAYAVTKTGEKVYFDELDVESRWWSSDTTVFSVQENGVATGKSKGDAYCILEATITFDASQLKKLKFYTGRDSAFVSIF